MIFAVVRGTTWLFSATKRGLPNRQILVHSLSVLRLCSFQTLTSPPHAASTDNHNTTRITPASLLLQQSQIAPPASIFAWLYVDQPQSYGMVDPVGPDGSPRIDALTLKKPAFFSLLNPTTSLGRFPLDHVLF